MARIVTTPRAHGPRAVGAVCQLGRASHQEVSQRFAGCRRLFGMVIGRPVSHLECSRRFSVANASTAPTTGRGGGSHVASGSPCQVRPTAGGSLAWRGSLQRHPPREARPPLPWVGWRGPRAIGGVVLGNPIASSRYPSRSDVKRAMAIRTETAPATRPDRVSPHNPRALTLRAGSPAPARGLRTRSRGRLACGGLWRRGCRRAPGPRLPTAAWMRRSSRRCRSDATPDAPRFVPAQRVVEAVAFDRERTLAQPDRLHSSPLRDSGRRPVGKYSPLTDRGQFTAPTVTGCAALRVLTNRHPRTRTATRRGLSTVQPRQSHQL